VACRPIVKSSACFYQILILHLFVFRKTYHRSDKPANFSNYYFYCRTAEEANGILHGGVNAHYMYIFNSKEKKYLILITVNLHFVSQF